MKVGPTDSRSMSDIALYGAFIDMAINKNGDVAVLTESKAFIVSFPRTRDSKEFSCVSLPTNDISFSVRSDVPFMIGRRIWWLPPTSDYDSIVLLTMNLKWVVYKRKAGVLQWYKSGTFSPDLNQYFSNVRLLWSHSFVDMVIPGFISPPDENCDVCEFQRAAPKRSSTNVQHVIDFCTMPEEYCLGKAPIPYTGMKKVKSKNKRNKGIKKEILCPPLFHSDNEEPDKPPVYINDEEKPVIKQLTKTSSSGEKRLVTYILDGKQKEEESIEGEEKVACVCGAVEENSSEDEEWVECELCHTWMHVDCVAYFPEVQDYYHCDSCLKKEKKDQLEKKKGKRGRKKKDARKTIQLNKGNNSASTPTTKAITETGKCNTPLKETLDTSIEVLTSSHDEGEECDENADGNSDSSYGMIHHGNHINCPCGASESESGEEWVQCDECDKWQHQNCVNYASEDVTHYQCPSCKQILTFFANKKFPSPITQDSLAGKQPAGKGKFRIPKLSKADNDGFNVVGSSFCASSMVISQLQPVYIPKSIDQAKFSKSMMRNCTTDNVTSSTSPPRDQVSLSNSNNSHATSNNSVPGLTDDERVTNGVSHTLHSSLEDSLTTHEPVIFAFAVCTDCVLILRGFCDSEFHISSLYSVPDRQLCCMAVQSNPENTEHILALDDYNSNEVLLWAMKYVNEASDVKSENSKCYPTLLLTDEKLLSTGPENIDRVRWLDKTKLLVCKMQTVICYDVTLMQPCWQTNVDFDFVIDWFLQSDGRLILFDDTGSTAIIDTNSGSTIQKDVRNQKEDVFIRSAISPSNLTRCDIKIPKYATMSYTLPCKLSISENNMFHHSESFSSNVTTLEKQYFTSNTSTTFTDTQTSFEISQDVVCPICGCDQLAFSGQEFGLVCSNNHDISVDPVSHAVLDPFTASECTNCGVLNGETAQICGACKLNLENLSLF